MPRSPRSFLRGGREEGSPVRVREWVSLRDRQSIPGREMEISAGRLAFADGRGMHKEALYLMMKHNCSFALTYICTIVLIYLQLLKIYPMFLLELD